jgi:hypothetical protein
MHDDLLGRLLEAHRPIVARDTSVTWCEFYYVHCAACDGNVRKAWQPGDPDLTCEFWREGLARGLVTA